MMYRFLFALIILALPSAAFAQNNYKGPNVLCAAKDGKTIYVANTDANEIAAVNVLENKVMKTIPLGNVSPQGLALSADEKMLYAAGGGVKGRVLAIDPAAGTIIRTAPAGHTPQGIAVSPDGTKLVVCNRFSNNVNEYNLPGLEPARTFKAVREPKCAAYTKDGKYLIVVNSLPYAVTNFPDNPDDPIHVSADVTIVNVETGESKSHSIAKNGSGSLTGICLSPDGRYAYITGVIARFLVPTTQVEKGWMNTAGIVILDTAKLDSENGGFVHAVLLDDIDRGAANPWGITMSPDGKTLYVAIAGTSEVITVDAETMHKKLAALTETSVDPADNIGFLAGLKKRIKLPGKGARAITLAGNNAVVGMYFSDTLQKIDAVTLKPAGEIALGETPVWTAARRGEIAWNDATLCLQQWQSCASCHPDARMDGYNWDLLNDGMGNSKNSKSLLYSHRTPPSMIRGVRDDIATGWDTSKQGLQCVRTGFQFIHFTMQSEATCNDVDEYLKSEEPVPSPYLVDGKLSEKAERGKKIFEDPKIGCAVCHPAPLFTDQKKHDVGTKFYLGDTSEFDTPTLIEAWRTAPYLHEGRYLTMRDLFKTGTHGDVTGDVAGLTDEQIDELVEYVLSL